MLSFMCSKDRSRLARHRSRSLLLTEKEIEGLIRAPVEIGEKIKRLARGWVAADGPVEVIAPRDLVVEVRRAARRGGLR